MNPAQSVLVDISDYLSPARVLMLEDGLDKPAVLQRLAECISRDASVTQPKAFIRAIFEREEVSSTGVGGGIAVPHAKLSFNLDFVISVGVSQAGIAYAAKDGAPVHIVVMIAAPESERTTYLRVLATIAAQLKRPEVLSAIRHANDADAVIAALCSQSGNG
ncbi:MAG: PTS sugar transporter subunit IIA [Planctomycetota bacterium]|nr:MAG: PTS sugar transporter subunit IIA [Planctomycetota bacterium]